VDSYRADMAGYYLATLRASLQLIVNDMGKLRKAAKKRNLVG